MWRFVVSGPVPDELPFLDGNPPRLLWEVGNQEVGEPTDNDGTQSFQDENPPPVFQAADAVHVCNCASQETSEGARDQHRAPEDRETSLAFFPLVPETDQVETWNLGQRRQPSMLSHLLPGKTPASASPRTNRVATRPPKFFTALG